MLWSVIHCLPSSGSITHASNNYCNQTGAYTTIVVNDDIDRAYSVLRSALIDGKIDGDSLPVGILDENINALAGEVS